MKKLIFFTLLLLVIISCNTKRNNVEEYTISMYLENFPDSTKFQLLDFDKSEIIDSSYLIEGKVIFKGKVNEPFNARIHTIDDKNLDLWMENSKIKINGTYQDFQYSKIEGSPLNIVMVKYRDQQKKLNLQRDGIIKVFMEFTVSNLNEADNEYQKIKITLDSIDSEVSKNRISGIESEEPSYHTIKELYFLRNYLSKDSLNLYFKLFPENLQNSKYGKIIKTYIDKKSIIIGDNFVDIEGVNEEGQIIKLSNFKGKYILLDFWASWCAPCRIENPNLVKTYKEFSDKGFEIFSFSTDNNINSWKKAVEKDSLIWTNVINENGSYSKMSTLYLYGVQTIPSSFLINPDGIIIAKNLKGKSLSDKLREEIKNHSL